MPYQTPDASAFIRMKKNQADTTLPPKLPQVQTGFYRPTRHVAQTYDLIKSSKFNPGGIPLTTSGVPIIKPTGIKFQ